MPHRIATGSDFHDHRAESGSPVNPSPVATRALLTIREAAALLRISDSTIRNAIRNGQLRAFRFGTRGGTIRIVPADLDDYVAGCATTKPSSPQLASNTVGGRFKNLDASKLLAAWRQRGVLDDQPNDSRAPSSGSCDAP